MISHQGHGAVVWDSSIVFAKYMEYNPQLFTSSEIVGKTVLELGSGCGLAGLSFMAKGADVTLTDLSHIVTELTLPNAEVYQPIPSPLIDIGDVFACQERRVSNDSLNKAACISA